MTHIQGHLEPPPESFGIVKLQHSLGDFFVLCPPQAVTMNEPNHEDVGVHLIRIPWKGRFLAIATDVIDYEQHQDTEAALKEALRKEPGLNGKKLEQLESFLRNEHAIKILRGDIVDTNGSLKIEKLKAPSSRTTVNKINQIFDMSRKYMDTQDFQYFYKNKYGELINNEEDVKRKLFDEVFVRLEELGLKTLVQEKRPELF